VTPPFAAAADGALAQTAHSGDLTAGLWLLGSATLTVLIAGCLLLLQIDDYHLAPAAKTRPYES
jgi:hypothetical protein